jgi:hypothetical protein
MMNSVPNNLESQKKNVLVFDRLVVIRSGGTSGGRQLQDTLAWKGYQLNM